MQSDSFVINRFVLVFLLIVLFHIYVSGVNRIVACSEFECFFDTLHEQQYTF